MWIGGIDVCRCVTTPPCGAQWYAGYMDIPEPYVTKYAKLVASFFIWMLG
jgi:hypothetical protein